MVYVGAHIWCRSKVCLSFGFWRSNDWSMMFSFIWQYKNKFNFLVKNYLWVTELLNRNVNVFIMEEGMNKSKNTCILYLSYCCCSCPMSCWRIVFVKDNSNISREQMRMFLSQARLWQIELAHGNEKTDNGVR